MGCNCKNKKTTTPPTIKMTDGSTIIVPETTGIPYNRSELEDIRIYLDSDAKSEIGKKLLVDWTRRYFGEEIIGGYCDPNCIARTRKRLELAEQVLNEYENKK